MTRQTPRGIHKAPLLPMMNNMSKFFQLILSNGTRTQDLHPPLTDG